MVVHTIDMLVTCSKHCLVHTTYYPGTHIAYEYYLPETIIIALVLYEP
jgi:hypothetical protein